jgi:hypothetical protein
MVERHAFLEGDGLRARIEASGLFDPEVYRSLHSDLCHLEIDPWHHFLNYGLREGRRFTNSEMVGRLLGRLDTEPNSALNNVLLKGNQVVSAQETADADSLFREKRATVGVFCSTEGNFYMRELAELLVWGLQAQGIQVFHRDENSSKEEDFGVRVFVAPHEFFYLGAGKSWEDLAGAGNSVLYNVEQVNAPWFGRVLKFALKTSLVLDINFQSAAILRRAGCNVVHFQPGYLPAVPYVQPHVDISDVELVKGYDFAYQAYNWRERDDLDDRPIDILFVGSSVPRRDKALARLQELSDTFRFLCIYVRNDAPLTIQNYRHASSQIGCAIGQRAKIVLNIHRDWLGYFEWPRMVLQGIWQGACVVSEPNLPNPIFEAGEHYLEESGRHIGELIRWLLSTTEGRLKLNETRIRGYQQARGLGSMEVALAPVLDAFQQLVFSDRG